MRRTILITGASSGLGEQMAREFAARGRDLALAARREDRLEELRRELHAAHPDLRIALRRLDVSQPADVEAAFESFHAELGTIDRVIVNAGDGSGRPLGTGGLEANLRSVRTNVIGSLAQCEAAMKIFRRQRSGHLVVISSVSAFRGMPRKFTTYAAGKAALASLAEGLRIELAGSPIVVSTILPGYIRTEMTQGLARVPFMVDLKTGARAVVAAIEREPATAVVPWWPWAPYTSLVRLLPRRVLARVV